jgi:hypothetical protein
MSLRFVFMYASFVYNTLAVWNLYALIYKISYY